MPFCSSFLVLICVIRQRKTGLYLLTGIVIRGTSCEELADDMLRQLHILIHCSPVVVHLHAFVVEQ